MSFYSELDNLSLSELIARFHGAPLEGEEYGYTYYSEVALLIRQSGSAGVEFLYPKGMIWNEAKQADTIKLRAILLALTQPRLEQPALRDWLLSLLQDKRSIIVAEAIDSLTRQGEADTLEQVLPLLKHASPYVRGSVLRFMSEFYPERAVPLLIEGLNDAHFIVRENATDELGSLCAVEALPFLRAKLEDPHPHVRQAAETAIEMLEPLLETEMADAQDVQVSMTLSKEAIYFLIEAIDHYLNDQQQSSWPAEGSFGKSDLTNGRYYLEAIKSNLKVVDSQRI